MERCAYNTNNNQPCESFHDLDVKYDHIEFAADDYMLLLQGSSSLEAKYWRGRKLDDILNHEAIKNVCSALGWKALSVCATHYGTSEYADIIPEGIYLEPKTAQIYRRRQLRSEPKDDHANFYDTPPDSYHTSLFMEERVRQLNELLETTPSNNVISIESAPSRRVA